MDLSDRDHKRILDFYQTAFSEHGESAKSLHWSSDYNQVRRFDILLSVMGNAEALKGHTILDVGCGFGDLYAHMLSHGIRTDYTGIDIVPEFTDIARKRFPEAKFETANILDFPGSFEIILASGAMSFKVESNEQYYYEMIRTMYDHSMLAAAFNMLDRRTHADNNTYASYSPEAVVAYCSSFAPRVETAIGYIPDDFTVFLYK